MLAATGRSGEPTPGGTVYAIDAAGRTTRIGTYPGPGGAEEAVVAPSTFGTAAGKVLLTVDAGAGVQGTVQAMDARGRVQTVAQLPDGPNPIVVVPRKRSRRDVNSPPGGLYVSDPATHAVQFAPASSFASLRGQVVVGTEVKALFWVLRPSGTGFAVVPLATNFTDGHDLEGATYIG
jgi:ABC-type nitrate/sulfonate/bicarbonate transport system substrate-binding protein